MPPALVISVVSLAVAVLAAAFSLWSAITAHRAHQLAAARDERENDDLHLALADSYMERAGGSDNRRYWFLVSVTNGATSPVSVKMLELRIRFRQPGDGLATIDIGQAAPSDAPSPGNSDGVLRAPFHLQARESASGWVPFDVKSNHLAGRRIDDYEIRAIDARSRVSACQAVYVKEVRRDGQGSD